MITPLFKLNQNEEYLFIDIKTPYAKLNDLDIFIEENDFRFYCKPYYLRLNLPGSIIENEDKIDYDFEENFFKLKYKKKNSGETFDGLDLLTRLLTPQVNEKSKINLIEELDESNEENLQNDNNEEEEEENEDPEDENQWYIEQNLNKDEPDLNIECEKYGFANTKSNVFSKLNSEYQLVIDLPDPDNKENLKKNRTQLRIEEENSKFDDDHYLADYFDDSETIENDLIKYEPYYFEISSDLIEYTEKEIEVLKNLPKKTYLLNKEEKFFAFSGLVDILFAYCYNHRINCGEKNSESGWTIAKLSATLSWFDTFTTIEEVILSSFRRSLCYPLYRNFKLTDLVFKDLIMVFKKGRKLIIKCLLEIRKIFTDTEYRYILNDLYINDYCVWIQYVSEKKIKALADCLEKIKITKQRTNFDLECLELAGKLALEENDQEITENSSSDDEESESESEQENQNKTQTKSKNHQENIEQKLHKDLETQELNFNFNTLRLEEKTDEELANKNSKIIELN